MQNRRNFLISGAAAAGALSLSNNLQAAGSDKGVGGYSYQLPNFKNCHLQKLKKIYL